MANANRDGANQKQRNATSSQRIAMGIGLILLMLLVLTLLALWHWKPGLLIAQDGDVLYDRAIGYGQINGAERKPLNAASRFRIGSITKMFTAVMILQLVDEGKLKLNDTLDRFFPQIPNAEAGRRPQALPFTSLN